MEHCTLSIVKVYSRSVPALRLVTVVGMVKNKKYTNRKERKKSNEIRMLYRNTLNIFLNFFFFCTCAGNVIIMYSFNYLLFFYTYSNRLYARVTKKQKKKINAFISRFKNTTHAQAYIYLPMFVVDICIHYSISHIIVFYSYTRIGM